MSIAGLSVRLLRPDSPEPLLEPVSMLDRGYAFRIDSLSAGPSFASFVEPWLTLRLGISPAFTLAVYGHLLPRGIAGQWTASMTLEALSATPMQPASRRTRFTTAIPTS